MKRNLKIIFMGTPEFAFVILGKIIADGYNIVAVFTQPDKKIGRQQKISFSPVKELALKHKIKVLQPANLKDELIFDEIRGFEPDLIIVAAYGKILPKHILTLPRYGSINIHASLLPKYRGASPIQEAILSGDKTTGITMMLMDEGLDTGDILAQTKINIADRDTAVTLQKKLAIEGGNLLVKMIPHWIAGKMKSKKQDNKFASLCRTIKKENGRIDWNEHAETIFRKWRAYQPWPGIHTIWGQKRLNLREIAFDQTQSSGEKVGKVVEYKQGTAVQTGKGLLILKKIQLEGKTEINTDEFVRGRKDFIGSVLI